MKNWKTTLAGAVGAAGLGMTSSDDANIKMIGQLVSIIGMILVGIFAKDNNVTGGTKQQ